MSLHNEEQLIDQLDNNLLLICPLTTDEIVDKALVFGEMLWGKSLYTYQLLMARRIIQSVILGDCSTITGLFARQSGKTEVIAFTCTVLCVLLPLLHREFPDDSRFKQFQYGFHIGIYAPIDRQAQLPFQRIKSAVLSTRVQEILLDDEVSVFVTRATADVVQFSNGSVVMSRTAAEGTQIEGETHHFVVIEEAQKMSRRKVEKEIVPMLAATAGTMVKIGTAWESRGGFHLSIQQNVDYYEKTGVRNHFEFPYDIIIAEKLEAYKRDGNPFHLNYQKTIDKELAKPGGADSMEFKMNFRCLWSENRSIAFPKTALSRAGLPYLERTSSPLFGCQVGGLDVGKTNDSSVLTIVDIDIYTPFVNPLYLSGSDEGKQFLYPKVATNWLELQGAFEGHNGQYAKIVDFLMRARLKVLVVDITGMGEGMYERLQNVLGDEMLVVPFRFLISTKSAVYKYYLGEFNEGRVKHVAGPQTQGTDEYKKFIGQHEDLDRVQRAGYTVYQASGASSEEEGVAGYDDYPDSMAMAVWGERFLSEAEMPEIKSTVLSAPLGGGSWRGARRETGNPFSQTTGAGSGRANRYQRRWH